MVDGQGCTIAFASKGENLAVFVQIGNPLHQMVPWVKAGLDTCLIGRLRNSIGRVVAKRKYSVAKVYESVLYSGVAHDVLVHTVDIYRVHDKSYRKLLLASRPGVLISSSIGNSVTKHTKSTSKQAPHIPRAVTTT